MSTAPQLTELLETAQSKNAEELHAWGCPPVSRAGKYGAMHKQQAVGVALAGVVFPAIGPRRAGLLAFH